MKIVIASDSFKGSLSGEEINNAWKQTVKEEFADCQVVPLLIADGGDGTLDAVIKQKNGRIVYENVKDPLFRTIKSRYGVFDDCAVISMCECSGLTLIKEEERDPFYTTSYGVGELIKKAVSAGNKTVYITLGGSATNDGGIGALTALGYKFIKRDGTVCKGTGVELNDIVKIDDTNKFNTDDVRFVILSDVTNPLTGEKGATRTFAKQKGANPEQIEFLEKGMQSFEKALSDYSGKDVAGIIGGGAAGGLGAALSVMLNAEIRSGVEEILKIVDFDALIRDADFIITGEGRIDFQSKDGKVVSGVLSHAKKFNVPVIAVVGSVGNGYESLYDFGLCAVFSIIDGPFSLQQIFADSENLYKKTAKNVLRIIKALKAL